MDTQNNAARLPALRAQYRRFQVASGKSPEAFETACALYLQADGCGWLTATPDEWCDAALVVAKRARIRATERMEAETRIDAQHEAWSVA